MSEEQLNSLLATRKNFRRNDKFREKHPIKEPLVDVRSDEYITIEFKNLYPRDVFLGTDEPVLTRKIISIANRHGFHVKAKVVHFVIRNWMNDFKSGDNEDVICLDYNIAHKKQPVFMNDDVRKEIERDIDGLKPFFPSRVEINVTSKQHGPPGNIIVVVELTVNDDRNNATHTGSVVVSDGTFFSDSTNYTFRSYLLFMKSMIMLQPFAGRSAAEENLEKIRDYAKHASDNWVTSYTAYSSRSEDELRGKLQDMLTHK